MSRKTFLINKLSNRKYRLNGIWPSNRLPNKGNLCQSFNNRVTYTPEELPPKVDLRNDMTTVENQSSIGSCSANALAGAYEYLIKKLHGESIDISRLFIYYNSREKDQPSEPITDSGCSMTSAIEALEELGTCLESLWPYDISKVNTRPNEEVYTSAKSHTISQALQVDINLHEMKSCLAQGFPFVFGLHLFTSFDKAAKTGVVPMPTSNDRNRQSDGSHALVAVGYSDQSQSFIVRNSWGEDWGDRGYCYIPYDYLTDSDLCFDVWTIRKVSNNDFGKENWDYNDEIDYQNIDNYNYDEDNSDDYRTIEQFDENDFEIDSFDDSARGYVDDNSWNKNDQFNYDDNQGEYDQ
ncbi:unnamed protein product [Adineta ricciae]|uniref:Peptidase C1A papain C-terminal domain-containing protein n=1 Tax=Adineta ricciae TaxID=249248 RepID=A0A814JF59_ADIRI|nr:unnamed protein product [Adineta ricciae]CAF1036762.1 unnamed protein product [Adineta ricciae]